MTKYILKIIYIIFAVSISLNATNTSGKIASSKKQLKKVSQSKKDASRQLSKIAKEIKKAQSDIVILEKKIDTLEVTLSKSEEKLKRLQGDLVTFKEEYLQASKELDLKQKQFAKLLADQFSIMFAMKQAYEPTKETIMMNEVYKAYKKENDKILLSLKKEMKTLKKLKKNKSYLRDKTKKDIASIISKKKLYKKRKNAKKSLAKKLLADEEKYNARLRKMVDKQNALRGTLAKLNILKSKEVEKARRLALARKEAIRLEKARQARIRKEKARARIAAKKAKEALRIAKTKEQKRKARLASKAAEKARKKVYKQSAKVKQVNSSYKQSSTYAYRGHKTISPVYNGRVIKKFGTYIDPIYKIKIFNEGITIEAPSSYAKVHNVLDGKVVYAGTSSMLGKVVVVAHSHKMHTIYAGLSKIAPTIHKGSKIKRNNVIGKVNRKLIFQATKNSKHINPLRLVKI